MKQGRPEGPENSLVVTKSKFDAARLLLEEDIGHVRTPSPRAAPVGVEDVEGERAEGEGAEGEGAEAPPAAPKRVVGKTRVVGQKSGAVTAGGPPRARARAKVVGVKPSLDNAIANFDRIAARMEDDMQRKLDEGGSEPLPEEGVPPEEEDDDLLDSLFAEMSAAPAPSLSLQPEQQEDDSDEEVELFESRPSFGVDSPLFKTPKQPEPQPQPETVPEQAPEPEPEPEPEPQPRSDPQLDPQAPDQAWVKLGGQGVGGLVAASASAPPPHRAGGPAVSYSIMSPAGGDRYVEFAVLLRPVDSRSAGLSAEDSLLDALMEGRIVSSQTTHSLFPHMSFLVHTSSLTDRRFCARTVDLAVRNARAARRCRVRGEREGGARVTAMDPERRGLLLHGVCDVVLAAGCEAPLPLLRLDRLRGLLEGDTGIGAVAGGGEATRVAELQVSRASESLQSLPRARPYSDGRR